MIDLMIGLLIGLGFAIVVNISWGLYCLRLEKEWAAERDGRDRAWQEQCAAIIAWYYTRIRAREEDGLC